MNKFKKFAIISILIGIISGVFAIILTFDAHTMEAISQIKTEYILLAVGVHIVSLFIQSLRIKVMCHALDHDIDLLEATKIVVSSMFVAALTPAAVAGEPLRIHLLNKRGMPLGRATTLILAERLMDALLILSLAPISLYVMRGYLERNGVDGRISTALAIGEIILLVLFGLMIYGLWSPARTHKIMHFLVNHFSKFLGTRRESLLPKILARVDTELEHLHDSVKIFIRDGRKGLILGMICTFGIWFFDFSVLPTLLLGLNQHFPFVLVYASQIILMVILVVSITPGAGGVAEIGATTLFSFFVASSLLGIIVVAWRAITFYMNLILGGFVSLKLIKDTEYIKKLFK